MFKWLMQLLCWHPNEEIEHIFDDGFCLKRCPDCNKCFLKKYPIHHQR